MHEWYLDTESKVKVSLGDLKQEFEILKTLYPDEHKYSFEEYIKNCCSKNGFLEPITATKIKKVIVRTEDIPKIYKKLTGKEYFTPCPTSPKL